MSIRSRFARWLDPSPVAVRQIEAATPSPRRFNAGAARFASYGPEVSAARAPVQSRARHASVNHPLARSAIEVWTDAAVGPGALPTSQHPDPAVRAALDAHFLQWAKRADVTRRADFFALQAAAVRAAKIDGEAFARWHGDALQALPAEMIAMDLTRDLSDGRAIVNGVELDADGRAIGYHVHRVRPTDLWGTHAEPVRVDAADMLHVADLEPGAVRGLSALAPVLLRLSELDQTEDAIQVGVKIAALLSVILSDENTVASPDDPLEGFSLEPGEARILPGNYRVHATAPQQAQQVGEFLAHMTRAIAAGVGVPEHLLTGDLRQANYSSLRAALVSFRQRVERYQYHVLVPQLLDPVWKRVATAAVLSGAVDAALDDDLHSVEWIMPAQPWVDPLKDAAATRALLEMGLMSRRQAVASLGYSIERLDAEIAADREREAALGLHFGKEKS